MGFIRNDICSIDLERIALETDLKFMKKMLGNDKIQKAIEAENYITSYPDRLYAEIMKRSFNITGDVSPKIIGALDECKERLQMQEEIKLYVENGTFYNASALKMKGQPIIIEFSSGLLENFTAEELTFVIGHELAHILYSHYLYPLDSLLAAPHIIDLVSSRERYEGYIWRKRIEITSDRIGLLCCRNFETAAKAFFKISTGVSSDVLGCDVKALLENVEDFKKMLQTFSKYNELYNSHPFTPLRIKCLELFSESKMYNETAGGNAGGIVDSELNSETEKLLALMEPVYFNNKEEQETALKEFIMLAGYYLMNADGKINDKETDSLLKLTGRDTFDRYIGECEKISSEELWQTKLYQVGEKFDVFLKLSEKHQVIKDLAKIIYADGDFDSKEKTAMDTICYSIRVQPGYADSVLQELSVISNE